MTEAYHIIALFFLAMGANFWNQGSRLNRAIKLGFVGAAAWGAVVVALDYVA